MTRADRDLLIAQIEASLEPVRGISSVQVYARGVPLEGSATRRAARVRPPPSSSSRRTASVQLVDGQIKPVPGLDALDGLDARSPARNEDGRCGSCCPVPAR